MSFSVLSCIGLLMVMAQPCYGIDPKVQEDPPNCLYSRPPGLYCLYILRNAVQINGGMRMLSNASGVGSFTSLELAAFYTSTGHAANVGVWAQGTTSYTSLLIGDIKLDLTLHVPDITAQGGRPIEKGWEIDFPFSLDSTVKVPFIGQAIGTNTTAQATAVVHSNGISSMILSAETNANGDFLEAKCGLTVKITTQALVLYHYEVYAFIDVAGKKDGYNVHYVNTYLPIFKESLHV